MAAYNKIILAGRLGKDPEVKTYSGGSSMCKFSLATDWQNKQERKTDWHTVCAFGKLAEACGKALGKGSQVLVEGSLHYGSYTDKNGTERRTADIYADKVEFLDRRADGAPAAGKLSPNFAQVSENDDIPF